MGGKTRAGSIFGMEWFLMLQMSRKVVIGGQWIELNHPAGFPLVLKKGSIFDIWGTTDEPHGTGPQMVLDEVTIYTSGAFHGESVDVLRIEGNYHTHRGISL